MSEWQPIETCPEDTEVIFGWSGLDGIEVGVMHRINKLMNFYGLPGDAPPTHWMPRPAAPALDNTAQMQQVLLDLCAWVDAHDQSARQLYQIASRARELTK